MIRRSQSLVRAIVAAFMTYLLAGGATFNGVLLPEFKSLTLGWVTLLVLAWLLVRWQRGWTWYRTVLDSVMLLWVLAFALSLAANTEIARRIFIGLWYVGIYIGVWYVLHDLLANNIVRREMLLDGFLIGSVIVIYFAYRQLSSFVLGQPDLMIALSRLPRPVGLIGNPNALGGLLVVLIPFLMIGFLTATHWLVRFLLAIYAIAAIVMLVLSGSRGAWVGLGAGIAVWGLLFLAQRKLLSAEGLRSWWQSLVTGRKLAAATLTMMVVSSVLVGILVLARTFSEAGRQPFLRFAIYDAAVKLFAEKPFFGHGLFTFGRGLARMQSMPPETAHSHTHNIPLQIGAELGLVGIAALVLTLILLIRAMWHNWQSADGRARTMMAGFIAAVVAFGVHQLTDIPAMMPAIALSGVLALVLAVAPLSPTPIAGRLATRAYPFATALLWVALLVTGLWSTSVYSQYLGALRSGSQNQNYRAAAEQMQMVIDADPLLGLYHLEQGELFGLAAYTGDRDAAREGVAVYNRFLALEPSYAVAWANKAALHWQLGEQDAAIEAMQQAVVLAPRSWELAINLGTYLERSGSDEQARRVYLQALEVYPCALDNLNWESTLIKQELSDSWRETCLDEAVFLPIADLIMQALDALDVEDSEVAMNFIVQAEEMAVTPQERAWLHMGQARFARFNGDDATAEREIETARTMLERGFLDNDFIEGINIAHSQYLRAAIQRLFLPQLYYPTTEPTLLRLLDET